MKAELVNLQKECKRQTQCDPIMIVVEYTLHAYDEWCLIERSLAC